MLNQYGCTGGCVLGTPPGMHTNGGCHCLDDIRKHGGYDKYRRVNLGIIELRKRIKELEKEVEGYAEDAAGASL